jgi:hypothetical protein
MGNAISRNSANARVYILLDDYEPENLAVHPSKTLYKVKSIISVNSKLSVDSGGTATVTFNDMDMKFWKYMKFKYINSREWGNEQLSGSSAENILKNLSIPQEISNFREHLEVYGKKNKALGAMHTLAGQSQTEEIDGGVLVPLLTPQNLIWIHYLGRDGNWYAGFTGVITQMSVQTVAGKTSVFTVNAKTPDIFFENSQLLIKTQNIGGVDAKQNSKLEDIDNLAMTNVFSGKITSEIIVDTINKVNNFFLNTKRKNVKFDYDPRYFKVRKLFGFGKDEKVTSDGTSDTFKIVQAGERGYPINNELFRNKNWNYNTELSISDDFYNGIEVKKNGQQVTSEEGDWRQVVMDEFFYDSGDKVKPFQNLIATSLDLFTVDKMTAKEVLDTVRKTVMCYIYFEGDGNLRVERPYFDIHLGMLNSEIDRNGLPPDYDLRYLMTTKDISYKNHSYSENSSGLVTRTELDIKPDWIPISSEIKDAVFTGKSESSWKTTFKFGEKQVQLNSIVSPKFAVGNKSVKDDILRSYCYAMRMLLSSDYRSLSLSLDQRPDLQLNRNMLFLDLGLYFVIKEISHNFVFKENRLDTTVIGTYVRPVGTQLVNPYRFIISSNGELKSWEAIDKFKEGAFNKDLSLTTEKNNPQELIANGETFESLEEFARNKYSELENFTSQAEGFDKMYASDGEEKNPYIICFRGLNDSHNDRQDFFDDFYLMLPATKTVHKVGTASGTRQMSCGDSQSAGTLISDIEANKFIDGDKTRPVFTSYTRLYEGIYRYFKEGNRFKCSNFKYYDLSSNFTKLGSEKSNATVLAPSSFEKDKMEQVKYISYMTPACVMAYNQITDNKSFMVLAEPKGTWWEGVNIFPASSGISEYNSVMSNVSDKSKIDVFVCNYTANDEKQIQDGVKDKNTSMNILNLNEQQKLFYVIKLIQKYPSFFKIVNKHKEWKNVTLPVLEEKVIYSSINSELHGLYGVTKNMLSTNYDSYVSYDATNNKQTQDTWFNNVYYNAIINALNTPILNTFSLNGLYDVMSQCFASYPEKYVKRLTSEGKFTDKNGKKVNAKFNYPMAGLGMRFPLKDNRAGLIALFHLFLQKETTIDTLGIAGKLNDFILATDSFFNWRLFSAKINAINAGEFVDMPTLVTEDMNIFTTNYMFGSPSANITYYDLFNLVNLTTTI